MPYNYAEQFEQILVQKYETEQKSWRLFNSNPGIGWLNAKTIKLPHITASGYKDHSRTGSFNAGTLTNAWEAKTLAHDRDVEFFIDSMDVDETNLVLSVANITNTFETEQAIPERDCYTFSKLYSEFTTTYSQTADTTALTAANILEKFDTYMSNMDDASVPEEGRILYVTPAVNKLLKEAQGITRFVHADSDETAIRRYVHELDDVEIISVPSARLKTAYNFTTGAVPATGAKQINMLLVHPDSVVARVKHEYIQVFTPGSDSRTGDGYIYQNRAYWDAFLLSQRVAGIAFNVEA
ncbi:MAG: hypothetical protein IKG69_08490 [Atopobiaceae bacterium]|nr:hypothetical protein [Atopobiaceae bacterium]